MTSLFGINNLSGPGIKGKSEENFKKALDYIDKTSNFGSSGEKAHTSELRSLKNKPYVPFIDSSIAAAEKLANSDKINEIRKDIKGGIEKPKTPEEKVRQWEDEDDEQ